MRTVPTHLPSGSPLGQQVAVSRKSLIVWAALALTFSLILAGPSGGQAEDRSTVALEVRGERLTLRAEDAPLAVILQRLAKAAGFVVYFKQPVEERVSVDLADVDLEEELQRLLNHRNTMFLYDKDLRAPAAVYVFGPRGGTVAPGISERAEGPLSASEPVGDDEIDIEAEASKAALKLEALDEELRAVSVVESEGVSRLLQNLMADPESSVRITALHWLAGRQEVGIDALATALEDSNPLVQNVAMQIILDRGVDDRAVEEVMTAAQEGDEATVRQMLSTLLAQR